MASLLFARRTIEPGPDRQQSREIDRRRSFLQLSRQRELDRSAAAGCDEGLGNARVRGPVRMHVGREDVVADAVAFAKRLVVAAPADRVGERDRAVGLAQARVAKLMAAKARAGGADR